MTGGCSEGLNAFRFFFKQLLLLSAASFFVFVSLGMMSDHDVAFSKYFGTVTAFLLYVE